MIDLFEEGKPLTKTQFGLIAALQNDGGGRSLVQFLEGEIAKTATAMIQANPSDIGAVSQLQARIATLGSVRGLIMTDPAKYEEDTNA